MWHWRLFRQRDRLEIASKQIDNLWIELIAQLSGQTFNYCITSSALWLFAQGWHFQGHLPTINFIIDEESFTTQVLIPSGGVVIGNLVSDGNYQWAESFPVESILVLNHAWRPATIHYRLNGHNSFRKFRL